MGTFNSKLANYKGSAARRAQLNLGITSFLPLDDHFIKGDKSGGDESVTGFLEQPTKGNNALDAAECSKHLEMGARQIVINELTRAAEVAELTIDHACSLVEGSFSRIASVNSNPNR